AIENNDMAQAKALYPKVRMYYERSEPVAEAFGDLDPKIDARLGKLGRVFLLIPLTIVLILIMRFRSSESSSKGRISIPYFLIG
ncbi:putative sulfate exporter family transporter, partial [Staphylococcus sp. EG-SA-21]|uniref:putative sulfate exporter family transporter n=1 Tax=Staphylococcus sp. EG-SA-21 TaxID=2767496 RepID=UPI001F11B80A